MKTVFDSDPEFSVNFTHCGVSVTLSGKVLTQDYLSIAGSAQENEQRLGEVVASALQQASQQAGKQLSQFHLEFSQALAVSQTEIYRSLYAPNVELTRAHADDEK
jgi:hypothetical protein